MSTTHSCTMESLWRSIWQAVWWTAVAILSFPLISDFLVQCLVTVLKLTFLSKLPLKCLIFWCGIALRAECCPLAVGISGVWLPWAFQLPLLLTAMPNVPWFHKSSWKKSCHQCTNGLPPNVWRVYLAAGLHRLCGELGSELHVNQGVLLVGTQHTTHSTYTALRSTRTGSSTTCQLNCGDNNVHSNLMPQHWFAEFLTPTSTVHQANVWDRAVGSSTCQSKAICHIYNAIWAI